MPGQRHKLTVSYRGTNYHGWQEQQGYSANWTGPRDADGPVTVQGVLRRAMQEVLKHPVIVVGSSRTDAGVHAKGQVAHFDTPMSQIPLDGMRRAINARLPDDIVVSDISPAADTFDAIRCTVEKRYQYAVWNGIDRPAFFSDLAFHRWQPLDIAAMRRAAAMIEGEHDFEAFAKPGHGRETSVRTVHECAVSARGLRITIGVRGSGFLWNMVRIIAGTLIEIGAGRLEAESIPEMLASRDRTKAGPTAPAHGLFLQWIRFGE